jgi:hypothetical protein
VIVLPHRNDYYQLNYIVVAETSSNEAAVLVVAAPPQASTNLASLQVKSLLDPSAAETTIDYLLGLKLDKEENFGARDDFKSTDICKNLVAAMEQNANNNSASFLQKCCHLIAVFTFKNDHFTNGFRLAGAVKA